VVENAKLRHPGHLGRDHVHTGQAVRGCSGAAQHIGLRTSWMPQPSPNDTKHHAHPFACCERTRYTALACPAHLTLFRLTSSSPLTHASRQRHLVLLLLTTGVRHGNQQSNNQRIRDPRPYGFIMHEVLLCMKHVGTEDDLSKDVRQLHSCSTDVDGFAVVCAKVLVCLQERGGRSHTVSRALSLSSIERRPACVCVALLPGTPCRWASSRGRSPLQ
jgi:hypothetical protein